MKIDIIDDETFLLFAAKSYYNPRCNSTEDFYEDLERIKYIKRLISRYREGGTLSNRLLMNHIIILGNSFTIPGSLAMLEFKISKEDWPVLKPFLLYLNYITSEQYSDIIPDYNVTESLKEI